MADPSGGDGPSSLTLPLATHEAEQAAVSFARERERVLQRSEHTASVRRFEKAVSIGLGLWFGTIVADWWVIERIPSACARNILAVRLGGTLAILLGLLVIIVARSATTLAPWRQGVWRCRS